jgi:hypothetical protein
MDKTAQVTHDTAETTDLNRDPAPRPCATGRGIYSYDPQASTAWCNVCCWSLTGTRDEAASALIAHVHDPIFDIIERLEAARHGQVDPTHYQADVAWLLNHPNFDFHAALGIDD